MRDQRISKRPRVIHTSSQHPNYSLFMRVDSVAMLRTRNLARIANCISPASGAYRQRFRELETSRITDSKKLAMLMNAICRSEADAPPARAHPHSQLRAAIVIRAFLVMEEIGRWPTSNGRAERDEGHAALS